MGAGMNIKGDGKPWTIAGGFSLRDWFAGIALQGELTAQLQEGSWSDNKENLAALCYAYADAMLKERNK
jgi:hypothetical protein